jgi:hypothetical protein
LQMRPSMSRLRDGIFALRWASSPKNNRLIQPTCQVLEKHSRQTTVLH